MRVTCPNCAATYEVPESRIGTGRRLRCARCQHGWWVEPPEAEGAAEEAAPMGIPPIPGMPARQPTADAFEGMGGLPARPTGSAIADAAAWPVGGPTGAAARPLPPLPSSEDGPPRSAIPLVAAWIATILFVAGGILGLLLFQEQVVAAWPPAERLYVALGVRAGG